MDNFIIDNHNIKLIVPYFPILMGNNIKLNYYSDIYIYIDNFLFIKK